MKRFSGKSEVDASIYDRVFDGSVNCKDLEEVYEMFNVKHCTGYVGRSLSMSDVVEVVSCTNPSIEKGFYYCDSIGFKKIPFSIEKSLDEVIAECDAEQPKQIDVKEDKAKDKNSEISL